MVFTHKRKGSVLLPLNYKVYFVLKLKDSRQTIFFQLTGTVPGPYNTFRSSEMLEDVMERW